MQPPAYIHSVRQDICALCMHGSSSSSSSNRSSSTHRCHMHWCTEPDIDIDIHDAMANVINLLFISNGRMVAGFFNFSQNDNADEINVRLCVLAKKTCKSMVKCTSYCETRPSIQSKYYNPNSNSITIQPGCKGFSSSCLHALEQIDFLLPCVCVCVSVNAAIHIYIFLYRSKRSLLGAIQKMICVCVWVHPPRNPLCNIRIPML